jgi:hypothetical protein
MENLQGEKLTVLIINSTGSSMPRSRFLFTIRDVQAVSKALTNLLWPVSDGKNSPRAQNMDFTVIPHYIPIGGWIPPGVRWPVFVGK